MVDSEGEQELNKRRVQVSLVSYFTRQTVAINRLYHIVRNSEGYRFCNAFLAVIGSHHDKMLFP